MERVTHRAFTDREHQTWAQIMKVQRPRRSTQIVPEFQKGLEILGMDVDVIPDLEAINRILKQKTGWEGVYVKGLEDGPSFYEMLSNRLFPIGHFVRDDQDLNYTPEPDIVHDLYGHMPFLVDPSYAAFSQKVGELAMTYRDDHDRFHEFERFYWFTLEFGLIKTPAGRRIFGAGIVSSIGECVYALSDGPEVRPFSAEAVRKQPFRIDEMQKVLFEIESVNQLYTSLWN